jgi:phosphoribosyl 1,2-cyclic phosphodiesterase
LAGEIHLHECSDEEIDLEGLEVTVRPVPHLGPTNGYRMRSGSTSLAYISDHQQPLDGTMHVADSVLELADGVDLLIHDAQYTATEFLGRSNWGHCSVDYACEVARQAGAKRLALFHHDPGHSDGVLDQILADAQKWGESVGIEVLCAAEGLTVSFA